MVREPLANGSRTKCAYVCMGLRTYAAPSATGSHTIRYKPKFVGFLRERKENWMRRAGLPSDNEKNPCTCLKSNPQTPKKSVAR